MSVAPLQFLLLMFAGWVNRRQVEILEYLREENRILRKQLGGRRPRFTDAQRRRLATTGQALGRRVLQQLAGLVTPDIILRWYRELIANKYDGTARREGGRSSTAASLQRLVVQFATANPTWDYTRIRGALYNLGHELGRNTIKRILAEHGLEPAPKRGQGDAVEVLPPGALRRDRRDRLPHRRGPHARRSGPLLSSGSSSTSSPAACTSPAWPATHTTRGSSRSRAT
jgi:hypothetical protein